MPLRDLTPTLAEECFFLVGHPSSADAASRPSSQWLRTAYFESDTTTTFMVPGDWPGSPAGWFSTGDATFPVRQHSSFEYYVDGEATFAAMLEAIETANTPDHFIVLIGWTVHLDFTPLAHPSTRTTLHGQSAEQIFRNKVAQGVRLRVLEWDNITDGSAIDATRHTVRSFNPARPASPPTAIAFVDANNRSYAWAAARGRGSHHQKILLVYGSEGLVAFYGGVDFNPDRVYTTPIMGVLDPGTPLHDVHARVTGEPALDLLRLAVLRWNHAQNTVAGPGTPAHSGPAGPLTVPNRARDLDDLSPWVQAAQSRPVQSPTSGYHVRIGQTIGNPEIERLSGQHSDTWPHIRHAISHARKFIYMEDQYFWSMDAVNALVAALPNIQFLTILLPPVDRINLNLRHRAIHHLIRGGATHPKVGIYTRTGLYHSYVHAKMFVFDDELAIVGSANCNRRGYEYDSEVIGVTADPSWSEPGGPRQNRWHKLELNAAHKLRMDLWAEHLNTASSTILHDGLASTVYWRRPEILRWSTGTQSSGPLIQAYTVGGQPWWEALRTFDAAWLVPPDELSDPDINRSR